MGEDMSKINFQKLICYDKVDLKVKEQSIFLIKITGKHRNAALLISEYLSNKKNYLETIHFFHMSI
jgi:hypothetical protein